MYKTAIWASAHHMTPEQKKDLERDFEEVLELRKINPELWKKLTNLELGVKLLPLAVQLLELAEEKGSKGRPATLIQPAGSPAFQNMLGRVTQNWIDLLKVRVPTRYAESKRESIDSTLPDGGIKKISVFRHQGWYGL